MNESNVTLDDEIAKARERLLQTYISEWAKIIAIRAFDDAVALLRPKLDAANAEKDAEIALLRRYQTAYRHVAEAWTEALRRAKTAEAALAESRTVTDAQRERVAFLLAAGVMQYRSIEEMVSVVCGVFEQPAAEGARS